MYEHTDPLAELGEDLPLAAKLSLLHGRLAESLPFVARIAVATFDPQTDTLRSYVDSTHGERPFLRYEAPLKEAPSLEEILTTRRPRVVNDLSIFDPGAREHTVRVRESGYRASYTVPMFLGGKFWGFLFFNSRQPDVFVEDALKTLDLYAHLVVQLTTHELVTVRVLGAALGTARRVLRFQDAWAGSHLDRVVSLTRLVGLGLRSREHFGLSGGDVERIAALAPLFASDPAGGALPIGSFLPEGTSERAAYELARHTFRRALAPVHEFLQAFFREAFPSLNTLRNVARTHEATLMGKSPEEAFELAAHIVALADIVEALTARRFEAPGLSGHEVLERLRHLSVVEGARILVEALACQEPRLRELLAPVPAPYSALE